MTLRSIEFGDPLEAHHFVQRVVHRPQIRIHLLRQVAGQKAQALAGLDRRAHQHDAPHLLRLQRLDRAGDREVGLAGARRADAEGQIMRADIVEVFGLIRAAGAHRTARRAHLEFVVESALASVSVAVHVQFLQRDVHALGIHGLALRARVQVQQHRFRALDRGGQSDDLKSIAAPSHFDAEPRLDLMQVLVERTAQLDQSDIVRRSEQHVARHRNGTHGGSLRRRDGRAANSAWPR